MAAELRCKNCLYAREYQLTISCLPVDREDPGVGCNPRLMCLFDDRSLVSVFHEQMACECFMERGE